MHTPGPTQTHNFCGVSTQGVVTLPVHGAPQLARLVKGPRDHLIPATVSAADDSGILHAPSKPLQAPPSHHGTALIITHKHAYLMH